MRRLSVWSSQHGSPADLGVFRVAAEYATGTISHIVAPVKTGSDLIDLLRGLPCQSVDHLVIAGHGGTTWIIDDEHGVTTGAPQHPNQISVENLAHALMPILTDDGLISLCACMCSRSPRWYLQRRFGRYIGSDWGPRAYTPGGQASFAARLRDLLFWHGRFSRVRGHRAAGHATRLALLAEHCSDEFTNPGSACETLFERALPDVVPDLHARMWWVRTVTGPLAERWLFGDEAVAGEIARRWELDHE